MSKFESRYLKQLQRICYNYHQRGIERSHTEIKRIVNKLANYDCLTLKEAFKQLEFDSTVRYKKEE